jgi:hypothetical protein
MTIHVKIDREYLNDEAEFDEDPLIKEIKVTVTAESLEIFKLLIHRGLNCWEDAPAELKDLGDMFTHGRITQNHTKQRINSKPESNPELATLTEQLRVNAFVAEHGNEYWMQVIRDGQGPQVMAGTWVKPISISDQITMHLNPDGSERA